MGLSTLRLLCVALSLACATSSPERESLIFDNVEFNFRNLQTERFDICAVDFNPGGEPTHVLANLDKKGKVLQQWLPVGSLNVSVDFNRGVTRLTGNLVPQGDSSQGSRLSVDISLSNSVTFDQCYCASDEFGAGNQPSYWRIQKKCDLRRYSNRPQSANDLLFCPTCQADQCRKAKFTAGSPNPIFQDWTFFQDVNGALSGPGLELFRQNVQGGFPGLGGNIDNACSLDVSNLMLPQMFCSDYSNPSQGTGYGVNGKNQKCGLSLWFNCREDADQIGQQVVHVADINVNFVPCPTGQPEIPGTPAPISSPPPTEQPTTQTQAPTEQTAQPTVTPGTRQPETPGTPAPIATPQPTDYPTPYPTNQPTTQTQAPTWNSGKTAQPTVTPGTRQPEVPGTPAPVETPRPTDYPTPYPTNQPTTQTQAPTWNSGKTAQPTVTPGTRQPETPGTPAPIATPRPTKSPTPLPTTRPSALPTTRPTNGPTPAPTGFPTSFPTIQPTGTPSARPSALPTTKPSSIPTPAPTQFPTSFPTVLPTSRPSAFPTAIPSEQPSARPSAGPTKQPTTQTQAPTWNSGQTAQPTVTPGTRQPEVPGTPAPIATPQPTDYPTPHPTPYPTGQPTTQTQAPTWNTAQPTATPRTGQPEVPGTPAPIETPRPTNYPTPYPTYRPTTQTQAPTWSSVQTSQPSVTPGTRQPEIPGTPAPVETPRPTRSPTPYPTTQTEAPTWNRNVG